MNPYMKKTDKLYVFLFFLFLMIIAGIYKTKALNLPLLGRVIYLDPGHGGQDPGSIYQNIYEKDINLDICNILKEELEKAGAIVYMTRYGDYDLSYINTSSRKRSDLNNRAKIINESKADMYISIHLNSVNSSSWHGAQVFFDDVNIKNKKIAELFQNDFRKILNTKREVKEIKTMLLNRKIKIPGVLIEVGFLSNPNDRYLLQKKSYKNKVCSTIKNTVIKYFNS